MTTDHLPKVEGKSANQPLPLHNRLPVDVRPMNSLVAAAKRLSGRKMRRSTPERWQQEGWDLYDEVGELHFVGNALASAGSKARLFAARQTVGDQDPQPLTEEDADVGAILASEAVNLLGGSPMKRAELLRRLLIHLFVPGDSFLVGLPRGIIDKAPSVGAQPGISPLDVDSDVPLDQLDWHTMAVEEVNIRAGKVALSLGDATVELEEDAVVLVRVWRPHPRRWWQADSPVKANLPVLRELVGLTKHIGASIDSRLAGAGLLVLGNSVEVMTPSNDDPDVDEDQQPTDFVDALMEAMLAPLEDRDTAASLVPLTIRVPDEAVDKVKHLTFSTPFDKETRGLRDEAIRRLALGLDAPPEVLLGLGDSNHWSAWQIDESTTKTHIEPVLALVCDALTVEYLWPILESAGVERPHEFVVWFDTANLTMRPNKAGEAMALHGVGELSGEALRRESGFGEEDAPDQELSAATLATIEIVKAAGPAVAHDPSVIVTLLALLEQLYEGAESGEMDAPEPTTPPAGEVPDSGRELPETQGDPPPAAEAAAAARRITARNGKPTSRMR